MPSTGNNSSFLTSPINLTPSSNCQSLPDILSTHASTTDFGPLAATRNSFAGLYPDSHVDIFSMTPQGTPNRTAAHIICTAPHELLLNNEVYKYVLRRNMELLEMNASLNRALGEMQGRQQEQRDMYKDLTQKITAIGASNPLSGRSPGPLDDHTQGSLSRDDFPLITYWSKASWAPYLQGGDEYHARNDTNGIRRYLQDSDGNTVPKARVTAMAEHQRRLWQKYRNQGNIPTKWSHAASDIFADHRREMYSGFPEFAYCDSHWKLALFASDRYPSWVRRRRTSADKDEGGPDAVTSGDEPEDDAKAHTVRVPKRTAIASAPEQPPKPKRARIQRASPTVLESRAPTPEEWPYSRSASPQAIPAPCVSILDNASRCKALLDNVMRGGMPASTPLATPTITVSSIAAPGPSASLGDNNVPAGLSAIINDPTHPPPGSGPPMSASLSTAKVTKLRVMKMSTTARNLAAIAYLAGNPNPTADEFNRYYESLSPDDSILNDTRHRFAQAHTAKNPGATAQDIVNAFDSATEDVLQDFRAAAMAKASKLTKARTPKGKGKEKAS
ncbi:hypothetical protein C2E23DRAFT_879962 [Lenzites betulinus]|nr:hypothetical protein C2E23DRAFT_879962 [Lenzites betulinus]